MDQAEPQPSRASLSGPLAPPNRGGAQPDGPQPYRPAGMPSPRPPGGADPGLPAGTARGAAGADPREEPQADSGLTMDLAHPVVVGYDGSGSSRHGPRLRRGDGPQARPPAAAGLHHEPEHLLRAAQRPGDRPDPGLRREHTAGCWPNWTRYATGRAGRADRHPPGQPGPGTCRGRRRVQRGRAGPSAPRRASGITSRRSVPGLAGPARALPGHRGALSAGGPGPAVPDAGAAPQTPGPGGRPVRPLGDRSNGAYCQVPRSTRVSSARPPLNRARGQRDRSTSGVAAGDPPGQGLTDRRGRREPDPLQPLATTAPAPAAPGRPGSGRRGFIVNSPPRCSATVPWSTAACAAGTSPATCPAIVSSTPRSSGTSSVSNPGGSARGSTGSGAASNPPSIRPPRAGRRYTAQSRILVIGAPAGTSARGSVTSSWCRTGAAAPRRRPAHRTWRTQAPAASTTTPVSMLRRRSPRR